MRNLCKRSVAYPGPRICQLHWNPYSLLFSGVWTLLSSNPVWYSEMEEAKCQHAACAAMVRKRDRQGLTVRGEGPSLEEASGPNHFHDHACDNTTASPDVDECLEQLDECHYNQLCENTPGGHHCGCPRGYRQQGHSLPCLGKGDNQNLLWVLGLTRLWLRTRSVYGLVSLRMKQ